MLTQCWTRVGTLTHHCANIVSIRLVLTGTRVYAYTQLIRICRQLLWRLASESMKCALFTCVAQRWLNVRKTGETLARLQATIDASVCDCLTRNIKRCLKYGPTSATWTNIETPLGVLYMGSHAGGYKQ